MSFEQQIQQWVALDNQLKQLNDKAKELRDKKTALSESILEEAETSNKLTATIQLNDSKIKFANTKVAQPLTYKYLETCLNEIISNKEQVEQIIEYVKNNRTSETVQEIKRISNK